MLDFSSNSNLVQSFLNAFPENATAMQSFVRRFENVERVPPSMLYAGMGDILRGLLTELDSGAPLVEYERSPEPGIRGPTPCFEAATPAPALAEARAEDTLTAPFSAMGYPVPTITSSTSSAPPGNREEGGCGTQSTQNHVRPQEEITTYRSTIVGLRPIQRLPRANLDTAGLRPITHPTPTILDMHQDWIARTATCTINPVLQSPRPSGTRKQIRTALGIDPVQRSQTILREDLLERMKGLCRNVLIINSKSTPMPTSEAGAPVFILDHIGPLGCTGWLPVVQVLCCMREEDEEEEVYVYMGRYAFRPTAEMRLSGNEWASLPKEMKHHICRRIEYARDENASKVCARAYLRGKGAEVDPPAVRNLLRRDVTRYDRHIRYDKPRTVSLYRDLDSAFASGKERLWLYSLQCEAYDEAFAQVMLHLLLHEPTR
ncbi:hypothetical protein PENSPDRAFT_683710 [Peniophora sp. CONT]|nr:hypothetical protein PENSPDRAFT_683710 [Peniophora sp. CONT]